MNVRDIVKEYLDKNGFEGLFRPDGRCRCLKEDLTCSFCEGVIVDRCIPTYFNEDSCSKHAESEYYVGSNVDYTLDYVVGPGKQIPNDFIG